MCMALLTETGRIESAAVPCQHPAGDAVQRVLRRIACQNAAGGIGQPEGSP